MFYLLLLASSYAATYVCTSPPMTHYVTDLPFIQPFPTHQVTSREHCYKQCGPCIETEYMFRGYRAWCNPSNEIKKQYQLYVAPQGTWKPIRANTISFGFFSGKPNHPFIFQTYLCHTEEEDTERHIWYQRPYRTKKQPPLSMLLVPRYASS